MKTLSRRFLAGAVITIVTSALNACSPVVYAPARPRPVVHVVTPPPPPQPVYVEPIPAPPVQPVVVYPVVPVWAPPYTYVTQVHYYYFPDYMVYYDVFSTHYVYYNGYSWLNVAVLPGLPMYSGFSPYNSYIVVLDRYASNPWNRHTYYQEQYPRDYYKTAYAPRQSLSNGTVLRAYDENQRKPLFVDRSTNKEVRVDYTVSNAPRGSLSTQPVRGTTGVPTQRNGAVAQSPAVETNSNGSTRGSEVNPRVNNSTVQNPANPRSQGSDYATINQRVQPNVAPSTGRGNAVRNQNETVRTNNNVMPEKKSAPVRTQQTTRTEPQVMQQAPQMKGSRNQVAAPNQRVESNVRGNAHPVDAEKRTTESKRIKE